MTTVINVGMADYKVAKSPSILMTAGLGSCVAVCIYDISAKIGGLAHIMLPSNNGSSRGDLKKYANILIPLMFEDLIKNGAHRLRMNAKIAGGAQMFSFTGTSHVLKIGERNIQAAEEELQKLKIPLLATDVGGNFGRTVNLDITNGSLHVRTINQGERVI